MLEERGEKLHTVIGLEVPDEELTARLVNRGKTSGRADDNPETIKNRLEVYHSTTSPLRDFYIKDGKYTSIHGLGSVDDIFSRISQHVDSINN